MLGCKPSEFCRADYGLDFPDIRGPEGSTASTDSLGSQPATKIPAPTISIHPDDTLSTTLSSSTSPSPTNAISGSTVTASPKSYVGAIVGGTIAGVVVIILLVLAAFYVRRNLRSQRKFKAPSRQIQLGTPTSPGFDQKFPLDLTPPPSASPLLDEMDPLPPGPIYVSFLINLLKWSIFQIVLIN